MDDVVRSEMTYQVMVIRTLDRMSDEAAKDGLLAEYEDVIDDAWRNIPPEDRVKAMVYDSAFSPLKVSAVKEWEKAELIKPPESIPINDRHNHKANKERALRKKEILVSVMGSLGLLYRKTPVSNQIMEE